MRSRVQYQATFRGGFLIGGITDYREIRAVKSCRFSHLFFDVLDKEPVFPRELEGMFLVKHPRMCLRGKRYL